MATGSSFKNRRAQLEAFRQGRLPHVISSAQSALNTAVLVNGGGAVAMLAFFGEAMQQSHGSPAIQSLVKVMLLFFWGTASAGIATGLSFVAQLGCSRLLPWRWLRKLAPRISLVNIALIFVSYALFLSAGISAYCALSP
jgi:hypothetical protein